MSSSDNDDDLASFRLPTPPANATAEGELTESADAACLEESDCDIDASDTDTTGSLNDVQLGCLVDGCDVQQKPEELRMIQVELGKHISARRSKVTLWPAFSLQPQSFALVREPDDNLQGLRKRKGTDAVFVQCIGGGRWPGWITAVTPTVWNNAITFGDWLASLSDSHRPVLTPRRGHFREEVNDALKRYCDTIKGVDVQNGVKQSLHRAKQVYMVAAGQKQPPSSPKSISAAVADHAGDESDGDDTDSSNHDLSTDSETASDSDLDDHGGGEHGCADSGPDQQAKAGSVLDCGYLRADDEIQFTCAVSGHLMTSRIISIEPGASRPVRTIHGEVGQETPVALVRRGEHQVVGLGQPSRLVSRSLLEYTLHKSTSRHRSAPSKAAEKLTQDLKKAERKAALVCGVSAHAVAGQTAQLKRARGSSGESRARSIQSNITAYMPRAQRPKP